MEDRWIRNVSTILKMRLKVPVATVVDTCVRPVSTTTKRGNTIHARTQMTAWDIKLEFQEMSKERRSLPVLTLQNNLVIWSGIIMNEI